MDEHPFRDLFDRPFRFPHQFVARAEMAISNQIPAISFR
jgi:hypothetical protein